MFELHNQLKKDTILVKDLKLCQLLLMNNSLYPWFILVPRLPNLVEIIDLSQADQILLMQEIAVVSAAVKKLFNPAKLNIAALGNMVEQLHIHIIARFKDDKTFPKPVWVSGEIVQYNEKEAKEITKMVNDELSMLNLF
ncbi:MAG: HIT domain-containing protein [Pseudomonadota bacterium]